jgi:hypothetical protein
VWRAGDELGIVFRVGTILDADVIGMDIPGVERVWLYIPGI